MDYGVSQDDLASVDDLKKLGDITNKFSDEISAKIEDLTDEINSKKQEIVAFKQTIASCEKPLEELADVENKCPVCQSDISDAKKEELIISIKLKLKKILNQLKKMKKTFVYSLKTKIVSLKSNPRLKNYPKIFWNTNINSQILKKTWNA